MAHVVVKALQGDITRVCPSEVTAELPDAGFEAAVIWGSETRSSRVRKED